MRNPNGYGTIFKLSGNRRKPWAIQITLNTADNGTFTRKYLGYYKTRKEALVALAEYNDNTSLIIKESLESIYESWSNIRFSKITEATKEMYKANWLKLEPLYKLNMRDIKTYHLQKIIDDNSHFSYSLLRQIKSLMLQLFEYAIINDLADKNYAEGVELPIKEKVEKEIFSDLEIKKLWDNVDIPNVDIILILIFTGYRIGELCDCTKDDVDLENRILKGGNKTEAGKHKIVGIYNPIFPLIEKRYNISKKFLIEKNGEKVSTAYMRKSMYYPALKKVGITKKTPHSCRHTFASLLNRFVDDKKLLPRLMGHTDLNMTFHYTHADYKQMYETVNKIKL